MGARAALLHAVKRPEYWDALILISATAGIESTEERKQRAIQDRALAERLQQDGVTGFLSYWQQTSIIRSQQNIQPDWLERMQSSRSQHTAKGLAASLRQFGQAEYPNLWPELEKVSCPTFLITGDQDSKYSQMANRLQTLIHDSQWKSITNAGHMPHLEAPDQTAEIIRRFSGAFFKNTISITS